MDAAWLEIPVWSVGGRSLSKQSRRIISRAISPVNRTEENYIRGTVFSKYTVEIDSNERGKKKFIETCRTAKSGHHCFPSLFPRNVSCVRCTLPLAFILVVSGLLMHYSVFCILHFAQRRAYVCLMRDAVGILTNAWQSVAGSIEFIGQYPLDLFVITFYCNIWLSKLFGRRMRCISRT